MILISLPFWFSAIITLIAATAPRAYTKNGDTLVPLTDKQRLQFTGVGFIMLAIAWALTR